jgi:hypothetical protein
MHPQARKAFNDSFSPEQYQRLLASIEADYPGSLDFRVAESPVFVPRELGRQLVEGCEELIDTLLAPDFTARTDRAIPPDQQVPRCSAHSSFLAIDFAVCRDQDGTLTPRLIELQGFPSLFGYQAYLPPKYRQHFTVPEHFQPFFGGLNQEEYVAFLRKTIVADEDPEQVVLLDIFPEKQKTRIDFKVTEALLGVRAVCYTRLIREGRALYYLHEGRRIRIRRIYNRLIFDDLANYPGLSTSFHLTDDVDVTWVGHPDWFFRISKFTLPLFQSTYVPPTRYLSDYQGTYPPDLDQYVLKPLFSFAGAGVQLHLTEDLLRQLPDPQNYILQRKVTYAPVIEAPDGLVKCEIRMLYAWPDNDPRPTLLTSLSRLSRGEMIGVRYNQDFTWVGGSACFFEPF